MKVYIHESSRLKGIYDHADEYTTAELPTLPSDSIKIIPVSTYCKESREHIEYIKHTSEHIILENCVEGSSTLLRHLDVDGLLRPALAKKFSIICSGEMPEQMNSLNIEYLMYLTGCSNQDLKHLMIRTEERPYTFQFLNNRVRQHRSKLIEDLGQRNLLQDALWSNHNMGEKKEGHQLPNGYDDSGTNSASLISWDKWKAGKIVTDQYTDSYFSVFAESTVLHRYAFITEKTWKPIIAGHSFLALASENHYDRLHQLGFKTFNGVIDESFVSSDNWEDREKQIVKEVERLIALDLDQVVRDSQKTLDYNINHFWKLWENYSEDTIEKLNKFIDLLYVQV
jgi:hypothetical protein